MSRNDVGGPSVCDPSVDAVGPNDGHGITFGLGGPEPIPRGVEIEVGREELADRAPQESLTVEPEDGGCRRVGLDDPPVVVDDNHRVGGLLEGRLVLVVSP